MRVYVCVPEGWGGGRWVRIISKYQNPDPALSKCHLLENKQKLMSQALYSNLLKTIWCQLDKGHIWHLQLLSDIARTNLLLALSFSHWIIKELVQTNGRGHTRRAAFLTWMSVFLFVKLYVLILYIALLQICHISRFQVLTDYIRKKKEKKACTNPQNQHYRTLL